ncbi:ERBB receptor feedback inhibitor 1 [Varanus komodoensis]|uniref:ERBB receptor feedback inhibitor 1 n=1 Tax=Varanus komodoensis TaxID=61221 RepID=A0A8D2Q5Y3_VARKO|nr:ERBB receptor feedback inhibitor 1 [Varanus komodoensis]XP_044276815.1 ERBB receptor feedback inhibitor 1 [Varanus komodoensis]XP_044276816.1 ERBB receptor feedback inhibitor 1 [Varanus komodoensis]XP_044276817.1 ERBB receptor feedback inhibitor 1 [Varanus komodoensis]KAF7235970.1 ERBB receptor feedback inhibitor 1 [Varanus komodoensis]
MSTASIAAPEMRLPLKTNFMNNRLGLSSLKACWSSRNSGFENSFFSMDPVAVAYSLNSSAQHHLTSMDHDSHPGPVQCHSQAEDSSCISPHTASPPLLSHSTERPASDPEYHIFSDFSRLSVNRDGTPDGALPHTSVKNGPPLHLFPPVSSSERSARPLPPLPITENFLVDEVDREVEFLTSSDTDFLLENCSGPTFRTTAQGRRSFRGCGQVNYAYVNAPAGQTSEEPCCTSAKQSGSAAGVCPPPPPPPQQLHRRLRRSHSGPAGSFHKPTGRISGHFHGVPPSSDDKPEVPPRVPIPPRVLKPDHRRWSAEVASNAYSDEDKPPKVPPREPLSQSHSRTPSPKSLPSYLNGVMPPTQSFAPDPKYVSSKALQRQHSEGSANKAPCILPIIENGKKVSSTHYYLLPERPPYLDRYEKFFQEVDETGLSVEERQQLWDKKDGVIAKTRMAGPMKPKHFPCMVSP